MSNSSPKNTHRPNTSVLGGAMIIAATIIGVGMFSLPIVMAGSWFFWGTAILIFTWFCMLMSGLMILEASLNYPVGSSFNTVVKDLLGNKWNILNGISVAFVLYILTYAYISASGSVLSLTARDEFGFDIPPRILGALFALVLGFVVWLSTSAVSRAAAFVLGVKILTFFLTFGSFLFKIEPTMLFNSVEEEISYLPFVLIIFPFCLTSFGFHGNVPSLIIHYGKSPKLIFKALLYGTLIALFLYIIWLVCAMGNLPREGFKSIIAQGGNMDSLVSALGGVATTGWVKIVLLVFSNFAVASSFLGVTLGLFDYIADLFKFDNSHLGRCKTAFVTFLPPIVCGLILPDGFLYAIGFAGLAATLFAVIIPGILALKTRKKFSNATYRVWGGKKMVYLIFIFGAINIISFTLSSLNLLPVYQ